MKPRRWNPPEALSPLEQRVIKRMKQRPLFVFLREHRHELFDAAFQEELAGMYAPDTGRGGHAPLPPALLGMVTLLQAYTGASDAEAVDLAVLDRRWQLVLGTLADGLEGKAPFSQGVLPAFRNRLIAHGMDRRLLERTVALAQATGGFGDKALRLALDASPLFSAGRVEDTYNLLGHAARKVLALATQLLGKAPSEQAAVAAAAGIPLLAADPEVSGGSLKARLDIAWERPEERAKAFARLVNEVYALRTWLAMHLDLDADPLKTHWDVVETILGQDVEPDPQGQPKLKHGVAPERRPSVEDGEARHGRKTRSQKFVGYKRHLALDLDRGLVLAAQVAPANRPEGQITDALCADLVPYAAPRPVEEAIASLHVDRAYLTSPLAAAVRAAGGEIFCKPWTAAPPGGRYPKHAFRFEAAAGLLICPAGVQVAAAPGQTARFPAATCLACPQRAACTTAKDGRSVHLHPDEDFLLRLRARQQDPDGRAALRERVAVEHALARHVRIQGRKARYKGTRKNLFAVRLTAAVVNLHQLRFQQRQADLALQARPAA